MGKMIQYKLNGGQVEMTWSEVNENIAKAEADGGEYVVTDDGVEASATQLDRIEAQTMYTALMTDTLLEEKV